MSLGVAVAVVVMGLCWVVGCSKRPQAVDMLTEQPSKPPQPAEKETPAKVTVKTEEGKEVTVEQEKGKITLKGSEGEMVVAKTADPKEAAKKIGLPLYAGAKMSEDLPMMTQKDTEGRQVTVVGVITKDAAEKVIAFYKKQLGAKAVVEVKEEQGRTLTNFTMAGKDALRTVTVMWLPEKKETRIVLASTAGE